MRNGSLCLALGLVGMVAAPSSGAGKRPVAYGPTGSVNRPGYTPPKGRERVPGMKSVGGGLVYGPTGWAHAPTSRSYKATNGPANLQNSKGPSRKAHVLDPVVNRVGYGPDGSNGQGIPNGGQAGPNRRSAPETEGAWSEPLDDALGDIENAWLDGQPGPLTKRLPVRAPIAIFSSGKFSEDIGAADLSKSVSQAVTAFETQSFIFNKPKYSNEGKKAFVSGKHAFKDQQGQVHRLFVSYGLELVDKRWQVTEFGHGQAAISSHVGAPKRTAAEAYGPDAQEQPFGPGAN